MSRITANDRVRRMLAIIPLVAAHPDGVSIDDLCTRFRIDRRILVEDLATVSFVGVAPYTPDTQIDVVVENGRVFVHLPQWFDRPLRLTPEQGLTLVAAGKSLLSVHGADPHGPLARALDKLAGMLGVTSDEAIDVQVGSGPGPVLDLLLEAVSGHRRVRLSYYTYGRDEHTVRDVEPRRVYAERGQVYLWARCCDADEDRVFRLDRIEDATLLHETFTPVPDTSDRAVFSPSPTDPRVVLDLAPAARWVVDQYPVDDVEELDDGTVRVTLPVSGRAWYERLLLRLGPDARIRKADAGLESAVTDAARRVLRRYLQHDPEGHGEG